MAGGGGGIQPLGQPGVQQQPALGAPNFFTGGTPLLGQGGNGWNAQPQALISNDPRMGAGSGPQISGPRMGGWSPQPQPQISNDPSGGNPLWKTRQNDPNSPFYNPNAQSFGSLWQTRQSDPSSPFYKHPV
jgi:hypothetical protein